MGYPILFLDFSSANRNRLPRGHLDLVEGGLIRDVTEGQLLVVTGWACRSPPTMRPADRRWQRIDGDLFKTLGERLVGRVWERPRMKFGRD